MVGTKFGCGKALCGACTVHLNGMAIRSCQTPVGSVAGQKVTTIEGLGKNAVQKAWIAARCSAVRLLPARSDDVGNGSAGCQQEPHGCRYRCLMSGNICRCGTYPRIRAAIKAAAKA